ALRSFTNHHFAHPFARTWEWISDEDIAGFTFPLAQSVGSPHGWVIAEVASGIVGSNKRAGCGPWVSVAFRRHPTADAPDNAVASKRLLARKCADIEKHLVCVPSRQLLEDEHLEIVKPADVRSLIVRRVKQIDESTIAALGEHRHTTCGVCG